MYLLGFDTFVFSILTITLGSYLLCRKVNNLGSIFFSHQQKIKICSDHAYYITPVTTLKTRHGTTISSVHVIIGRYRFKVHCLLLWPVHSICVTFDDGSTFILLYVRIHYSYSFVFINFVQNPGCFNLGFVMIDYAQHVLNTLILYKEPRYPGVVVSTF